MRVQSEEKATEKNILKITKMLTEKHFPRIQDSVHEFECVNKLCIFTLKSFVDDKVYHNSRNLVQLVYVNSIQAKVKEKMKFFCV